MKNRRDKPGTLDNIVRITFDSEFYLDRGIQSASRFRVHKALKYFRHAIDKDPKNVEAYFHLAGLLAELGRFEESNEILETLIQDIDSKEHTCLYYIANNFLCVGDFESAEKYLISYLKSEPNGEYESEAYELLDMVVSELERHGDREPLSISFTPEGMTESDGYHRIGEILEDILESQQKTSLNGSLKLVYSPDKDSVLTCILQRMSEYSEDQREDAKDLWYRFITSESGDVIVRKKETWAAAVEYIVSRKYGFSISKKSIAHKYKVSTTSLNRNVERIQACIPIQDGS